MTSTSEDDTDPARAFNDLCAEVAVLRRAVEALPRAWKENRAPDYSPDLSHMKQRLGAMEKHLEEIEDQGRDVITPAEQRKAVFGAGRELIQHHVDGLSGAAQALDQQRSLLRVDLEAIVGRVHSKNAQLGALTVCGLMAFLVGFAFCPAIAAILPFKLNTFVASFIMRSNRWDAGQELMALAHPGGWKELADASDLVRANRDAITKCRAAAIKSKAATCKIIVVVSDQLPKT